MKLCYPYHEVQIPTSFVFFLSLLLCILWKITNVSLLPCWTLSQEFLFYPGWFSHVISTLFLCHLPLIHLQFCIQLQSCSSINWSWFIIVKGILFFSFFLFPLLFAFFVIWCLNQHSHSGRSVLSVYRSLHSLKSYSPCLHWDYSNRLLQKLKLHLYHNDYSWPCNDVNSVHDSIENSTNLIYVYSIRYILYLKQDDKSKSVHSSVSTNMHRWNFCTEDIKCNNTYFSEISLSFNYIESEKSVCLHEIVISNLQRT